MADIIIVGAGIAGLTVGLAAIKKRPGARVLILEAYDYVGGRIVTYHKSPHQWEIGAGRIASTHTMLRGLMDTYGLTWKPLANPRTEFAELAPAYLDTLRLLPESILATHTIFKLLQKIHGQKAAAKFAATFPYWAELHRLRADLALKCFEEEMGAAAAFGVCAEGLDQIPKRMAAEFESLGGQIWLYTRERCAWSDSYPFQGARHNSTDYYTCTTCRCNCCPALRPLASWPLSAHGSPCPHVCSLSNTYMVYCEGSNHSAW